MAKRVEMQEIDSVSRSLIMIDEKNLNVFIRQYTEKLSKRGDVWGFICAFVSTSMTLVSSKFSDFWGLSGDMWFGVFLTLDIGFLVMLCRTIYGSYKARGTSPDKLIEEIKNYQKTNSVSSTVQSSDF